MLTATFLPSSSTPTPISALHPLNPSLLSIHSERGGPPMGTGKLLDKDYLESPTILVCLKAPLGQI